MAKRFPTATLDGLLDVIAGGDKIVVCSAEPTTFAEANATFLLAGVAAAGVDFTKAAGAPTGRKVTVAAKAAVAVTASGTATHVAVINTVGSTIRAITTCTSQALTSGNTVNIPAHAYTVVDPV